MNLTIEIENKEDFPFIKKLMENLKGVKIVNRPYDENISDELPLNVQEALENYADNLKDEDCISKEEFFQFVDSEICRLNSRK
ncbi:hypothetical protein [Halpernia sp.]|uniref:hypothetical protein n=1 Tax=Halpernia sp. TaxID=2782209 RepID=UPI003A8F9509